MQHGIFPQESEKNKVINVLVVEDQDFQFAALTKGIKELFSDKSVTFNFVHAKNDQQALDLINNKNNFFQLGIFDNQICSPMEGQMLVAPFKEANPEAFTLSYSRDFAMKPMPGTDARLETKPFLHKTIVGDQKTIDPDAFIKLPSHIAPVKRDVATIESIVNKILHRFVPTSLRDKSQKILPPRKRKASLGETQDFPDEASASMSRSKK